MIKQKLQERLDKLELDKHMRHLPQAVPGQLVNLSSNDYLGLTDSHWSKQFYKNAAPAELGLSAASSRLLTGNHSSYAALEQTMARAFGREACLAYNSGYHANIGILSALSEKKDLIIADKLVHASIIDGIMLAKAEFRRYNHLDYEHLDKLLTRHRQQYDNVFIVTESIFSMDGDVADLQQLAALKQKHHALLYVDEAHAIGVRGRCGLGCAEEQGCLNDIDFMVGTFGKAISSVGAYLVCDQVYKDYLVNTSRSLIFTTGLPPVNVAWSNFVIDHLAQMAAERKQLSELAAAFSTELTGTASQSHIVPYIVGENSKAVALSAQLSDLGFWVMPIRHPTVPKGTARLRFSLKSDLKVEQLRPIFRFLKDTSH